MDTDQDILDHLAAIAHEEAEYSRQQRLKAEREAKAAAHRTRLGR